MALRIANHLETNMLRTYENPTGSMDLEVFGEQRAVVNPEAAPPRAQSSGILCFLEVNDFVAADAKFPDLNRHVGRAPTTEMKQLIKIVDEMDKCLANNQGKQSLLDAVKGKLTRTFTTMSQKGKAEEAIVKLYKDAMAQTEEAFKYYITNALYSPTEIEEVVAVVCSFGKMEREFAETTIRKLEEERDQYLKLYMQRQNILSLIQSRDSGHHDSRELLYRAFNENFEAERAARMQSVSRFNS